MATRFPRRIQPAGRENCPDRWKERLTLYNHFPPRIDVIGTADGEYCAALFLAPRLGYHSEPGEPEINVDLSFSDREAAEQTRNLAQDNFSAMDAWLVTLRFTWPEFSQQPALPVFVSDYIESELPSNVESRTFIDHLDDAFVSNSCLVERNPFIGRVRVDIYATKKGKSFGLIPYVDHYFVFILESEPEKSLETLLSVNRNALSFVDSIHRTPRLWRWTVPTTTTIAIFSGGIPSATAEYVREQNLSAVGVPNALILVDLQQRNVMSVEHKLGDMGTLPIKRASTTIRDMCDSVFQKLNGGRDDWGEWREQ